VRVKIGTAASPPGGGVVTTLSVIDEPPLGKRVGTWRILYGQAERTRAI
jgi:hypothetical protein